MELPPSRLSRLPTSLIVTASLLIALGLFVGAYFGARFGQSLDPATAKKSFAVFLIVVSARIWFTA